MTLIAMAANNAWAIVNYRSGLVRVLREEGYDIVVIAPDGPNVQAVRTLGARFEPLAMQPRGTSPIADFALFLRYRRTLRRLAPAAFPASLPSRTPGGRSQRARSTFPYSPTSVDLELCSHAADS